MTAFCPHCGGALPERALPSLTEQQMRTARVIEAAAKRGVGASYTEIQAALGLHSKSGVHRLVQGLAEKGWLVRRPNRARSLALTRPLPEA